MLEHVQKSDSKVAELICGELKRQQTVLEMIPSENIVSPAVLDAMGSVLTNKYSEGYPHKRYYGGNEVIDQIEDLAIERAKAIFKCEHVNVQPYSGSPANMEVYFALMEFGDSAMGMSLSEGGHLTHGHPVSYSGKAYKFTQYGVSKETELLDYDAIEKMAKEVKPKMIVSGHSAYPRQVDFKRFAEIAQSVDAISMADIAHVAGLVVAGEHPSPFPFTDVVTTTTHKTLRGPRGAMIMCKEKFAKQIDKAVFPGMQGGPHEHIIAGKAVAFAEAATPEFAAYARQIVKNAKALGESLSQNGIRLVTGGTDNHLVLCDLTSLGVSGKQAETALDLAHITVNKNTIPFDPRTPFDPSGIRVGTPVLTSRGMKQEQMTQVGELIAKVCKNHDKQDVLDAVKKDVLALCENFPLYQEL